MPAPLDHDGAVRLAVQWLGERHRKGWRNALVALVGDWLAGRELPRDEGLLSMLDINAGEWLLARGSIQARGEVRPINAYLLGPDGPALTPGQQRWIGELAERPLRLFRVTGVVPGQGLTLVDELDEEAPPFEVREVTGSRTIEPGMLLGARIMQAFVRGVATHLELSGALYVFAPLHEPGSVAAVREAAGGSAVPDDPNRRDLAETAVARAWLAQWLAPPPLPEIRDASTGEALLLVTDHYRVADAAALARALGAQPGVTGDALAGWVREGEGGQVLAAINPGRAAGRIEAFYRTRRLADEGRAWFDGVAGAAVHHLEREVADPRDVVAAADAAAGAGGGGPRARAPSSGSPSGESSGLPPEALAQAIEQTLRKHYAGWCDEPIPALHGRTPRQAIATAGGLERVKGLLRQYEEGERQAAREQRRPAVSFQFLWNELGNSR